MATDRETQMLEAVWKKAFKDGDLTLTFDASSDRTNIRFKLYNVAKRVKKKPEGTNYELEDAVGNCSISLSEDEQGRFLLRVYRKDRSLLLQSIAAQIGEPMEGMATPVASPDDLEASMRRMMEVQEQAASATDTGRAFPYPVRHKKEES